MAWAYCKCGAAVPQPTARQVLKDEVYCLTCGRKQEVDPLVRNDAIDELFDRVERLEKTQ